MERRKDSKLLVCITSSTDRLLRNKASSEALLTHFVATPLRHWSCLLLIIINNIASLVEHSIVHLGDLITW